MRKIMMVLIMLAVLAQPIAYTINYAPVAQEMIETVSSGKLIYKFDLSHGGLLYDLSTNCSDFNVKSVGADRGGTQRVAAPHAVLWDIITTGATNEWEGYAVDRQATFNIVEENDQYIKVEISYSMDGTPFAGLRVVKTYTIYKDEFYADVAYRLENTGDNPVTLDVTDAWGRSSGLMLEMVAKLGETIEDDRQIIAVRSENGTLYASYITGSSWSGQKPGAPLTYPGQIELIGIFDNSSGPGAPSPWGFALLLRILNQSIPDTYSVWLETGAGGGANIINRIEFAAITLNPGESKEYYMRLYAGPIYLDTMKKAGFEDVYERIWNPAYPSQPPCSGQAVLPQNVKVGLNVELTGPMKLPNAAIKIYQGDSRLYAIPINTTNITLGFPEEGRYVLEVSPTTGLTLDGRGKFAFLQWVLPDGSVITENTVAVDIKNGDTITVKFKITPIVPVYVFLVSTEKTLLPQQAENITVKIYDSTGQLVYSYTSTGDDIQSRNITVKAEGLPGLEPGAYVIELPAKAGIYVFKTLEINGKEAAYDVSGDTVRASFTVPEMGADKIEINAVYEISSGTAGVSYMTWIIVIAVLVALGAVGFILQKKGVIGRKASPSPAAK